MSFLAAIWSFLTYSHVPDAQLCILPLLLGAIIGAAMGGAKALNDNGIANRQRKVEGATTRFSPWTGMQAAAPKEANFAGDIMGGAMGGAMTGQSLGGAAPTGTQAGYLADLGKMGSGNYGSPYVPGYNTAAPWQLMQLRK